MIVVLVSVAAACGAVARYLVDRLVARLLGADLPWGTFVVNTSGSFAVGVLAGVVTTHGVPTGVQVVVGTGFLGAYTTFSTWMVDVIRLREAGERRWALASVVASPIAGVAAVLIGLWIGGAIG